MQKLVQKQKYKILLNDDSRVLDIGNRIVSLEDSKDSANQELTTVN